MKGGKEMVRILWLGVVGAFAATCALAGDVLESRFDNTIVSVDSKGVETRLYYHRDNTFTGTREEAEFRGTWSLADGEVCLAFDTPLADIPNPFCSPAEARQIGETWTAGEGDQQMTITLVEGR